MKHLTSPAAQRLGTKPTVAEADHRAAAVARLGEAALQVASHIVARARAVHQLGATTETCRATALELDLQADRAEVLLFGQAVQTFRAAAAENRLMADALEAMEWEKSGP